MAVTSRVKKWKDNDISPERTKVWTEPKTNTERKVPVVYYLSRNGQLEHPHFMEVPLSSSEGLYLRDVINRLNSLRGNGMASMYSWSSKRSYKKGFVWHDLSENDFIYPAHGQDYVLKGSELLEGSLSFRSPETVSSIPEKQPERNKSDEDCDFPVVIRRRNQSRGSIDLHEYKVYKAESTGESAGKAADASTQTDDKRRRRRIIREEEDEQEKTPPVEERCQNHITELSREEISPPPSDSSPETLESLVKGDSRLVNGSRVVDELNTPDQTANNYSGGRNKASAVLMQLITCGSILVKDCGPTSAKDQEYSLVSHYRARLQRGASNQVESPIKNPSFRGIKQEDNEYFSGSLIETKKEEFSALRRSSSYNADRSSKLDLAEKEMEGVRAKCIARKPKTTMMKEGYINSRRSVIPNGSRMMP
ncbi:hypothetical protein HHK36_016456 [Tetracentron sinense]|uniref:SOSEKI DIX-like domain-containing protein n=1 Tax=Tetracentron sinense TaxID=13715 RepID=A0A834Z3F5_TETSI|nr:hypothetical protein HHK36_016456 [Tetracentron sinense]